MERDKLGQFIKGHKVVKGSEKGWFKKGLIPWCKGKHLSVEHRRKISVGNKGKKQPKEAIKKIREALKKRKITEETRKKISKSKMGKKNPQWRGGVTPLRSAIWKLYENKQWHSDVFQRDNWTCQTCGKYGGIEAHHIKAFSKMLKENNITSILQAKRCEELWDVDNGVTLCEDCHKLTKNYGKHTKYMRR